MSTVKRPKRNPQETPRSAIRSALRRLWLRSRERAQALKNADRRCARCGRKHSTAKGREVCVEVHHVDGIDWNGVIDIIKDRVLQHPDKLKALCTICHDAEHS